MKLTICDDEQHIREYIADCVRTVSSDVEIEMMPDAEKIMSPDFDADILFLDIQMPGNDGMKAARVLRENGKKTVIVFVTALEELVFDAFEVGAFRYILKPFDREKLVEIIEKSLVQAKERKDKDNDAALHNRKQQESKKTLNIKAGGLNTNVEISDIAFAEIYDRMIVLHMVKKDRLAISQGNCSLKSGYDNTEAQISYYGRMSDLEKIVGNDFFRIHRAYLINLKYIKSYDSKHVVIMGNDIPVARGKYQQLVKAFLSYRTRQEGL